MQWLYQDNSPQTEITDNYSSKQKVQGGEDKIQTNLIVAMEMSMRGGVLFDLLPSLWKQQYNGKN